MLSIRAEVVFVIEELALTVSSGGGVNSETTGGSDTVDRQAPSSNPSSNPGSNPAATSEHSFVPYFFTNGLRRNIACVETSRNIESFFNSLIAD